jgi:membrane protease YdiL (CAAX protease family)
MNKPVTAAWGLQRPSVAAAKDTLTSHLAVTWRALRPTAQVGLFSLMFLVLSVVCAAPFALLTGRNVVGLWYILPFTVVFVYLYQRFGHKEGLEDIGLPLERRWLLYTPVAFLVTGCGLAVAEGTRFAFGWFEVTSSPVPGETIYIAGGVLLALTHNFCIGFGEEIIFRGYMMRRLLRGYRSAVPAVVIPTLFFVGIHLPSKYQHPMAVLNLALLSVVLALTVIWTRTIWLAIGIHWGWDFWIDGIFFYLMPDVSVTRMLQFRYHLYSTTELIHYKLLATLILLMMTLALISLVRRKQEREKTSS